MSRKRIIPATMATQHPDHAHTPYWHYTPFISTQEETYESYLAFSELGIGELKWDWEGKLVDEAVVERLIASYYDYFKAHPLGEEKFLTFRLPNPKVETEFRLGRAFMGIMAASGMAKHFGLVHNPLFEVILPMTETAQEMIGIQEAFAEMASLKHPLLKRAPDDIDHIELIPLFEDIRTIVRSDEILEEYIALHKAKFKFTPEYIRPYVARSDPALNAGIVPTVLAIKIALSRYAKLSKRMNLSLYPIIGAAALPFRGGISPKTVDAFMNEYKGIRTTTIQSAFRYDYPKDDVIKALQKLEKGLIKSDAPLIAPKEEKELIEIMNIFEGYYKKSIESLAPLINLVAGYIPKRRERVQHTGLFGYSRGVGTVKLPRAITFTAALYSLGIPPELIGTGRGIKALKEQNKLDLLDKYYLNIRSDLLSAMEYVNFSEIEVRAKTSSVFFDIYTDVEEIVKFINYKAHKPQIHHNEHRTLTQRIWQGIDKGEDVTPLIEKAAFARKSIG